MPIKRIAFLASGNGGSLKFVHQAIARLELPLEICAVFADRECDALEYAARTGLAHELVRYSRKTPTVLRQALADTAPDIVVTNIHKIIDAETLDLLPNKFINLHYSILPAFKGLIGMETVEQARQANVGIIGATCHAVDELVDNGETLSQFAFGVDWRRDQTTQVYDLVFRGACIALLQGILSRTGVHMPELASAGATGPFDRPVLFSPELNFEPAMLDEAFWEAVKNS